MFGGVYTYIDRYECNGSITGYLVMDRHESIRRLSSQEMRDLMMCRPNTVRNLKLTRDGRILIRTNENIRTISEDNTRNKLYLLRKCLNRAKMGIEGGLGNTLNTFIKDAYSQGFTFKEIYDYILKTATNIVNAGQVDCKRYADISNYLSRELGKDYTITALGMGIVIMFNWDTNSVMGGGIDWVKPSYCYRDILNTIQLLPSM